MTGLLKKRSTNRKIARGRSLSLAGLLILIISIATFASPAPALAHAKLLKTSPAASTIVDVSPSTIQLYLSEAVSLDFSTLTLYDRGRNEQPIGQLGRIGSDDTTVQVSIDKALPAGAYTVVWRVLSQVDGHLTAGSFSFRVRGDGTVDDTTTTPADDTLPLPAGDSATPFEGSAESPDIVRWFIRALLLASAALLMGGPLFMLLVIEPGLASTQAQRLGIRSTGARATTSVNTIDREGQDSLLNAGIGRRFAQVGSVAALLFLFALSLDLILQIASIADTNIFGGFERLDSASLLIGSTRYGFAWMLKAFAGVTLLGVMLIMWRMSKRGTGLWEVAVGAASILMLGQSLGSHAAAIVSTDADANALLGLPLPLISDWLHLVMVGVWVGGLGSLAFALFPAFRTASISSDERQAFLARVIPRFSRLAVTSVVVLGVTGTYNLILHSNDLGAILSSQYGQVLALKVGLYGALVAIGAINLRRLTPRLIDKAAGGQANARPAESAPVRDLRRNIKFEVGLGILALVCAGGLTLLPPPTTAGNSVIASGTTVTPTAMATAVRPTPLPTPGPASAEGEVLGYNVSLLTRPSLEGDELTLTVDKVDPAASPLTDVVKVLFKVTPQDIDAGSITYTAEDSESGSADRRSWRIVEPILTLDGVYLITAVVQRSEADDLKAAFQLVLSVDNGLKAGIAPVIDLRIATDPNPPVSSGSSITVTLQDGSKAPIENANVAIAPYMPAHAHVEPTVIAQPVPGQPGSYSMNLHVDMGGAWLFIFDVEQEGGLHVKTDASLEIAGPTATPNILPRATPTKTPTPAP